MFDKTFWNDRYSSKEYLYGVKPNTFLEEHVDIVAGPVLSLSEGEGRNAVFLAVQGLQVLGVDISEVALSKARALAELNKVEIQTEVADLAFYEPKKHSFGTVISISAHLPSFIRNRLYPLVEQALIPGGSLIFEAYSEKQLSYNTGGPKDVDMLMTTEKLEQAFPNCAPILLREVEREVSEGKGHTGLASVVQFIARKHAE